MPQPQPPEMPKVNPDEVLLEALDIFAADLEEAMKKETPPTTEQ